MKQSQTIPDHMPRTAEDELAALRTIVEGTASATGRDFFYSLVEHLSKAVDTRYALVAEFAGELRARTLGYWKIDHVVENIEWDLRGTPCEDVVRGNLCHHPTGVSERFASDEALVNMGIQSYLGVPLQDEQGNHLGHLAVFDDRPMPAEPRKLQIFRIFAARATAELVRLRAERMLRESEEQFRHLYEGAPVAYLYTTLDGKILQINSQGAAMFGYEQSEMIGMLGIDLTTGANARERAQERFAKLQRGEEIRGVEFEMKRRNGQPLWVSAWSRPELDKGHTRTVLIDITDRVLMEQEKAKLQQQNLYLQEEIKSVHNFEEIVGRSPALVTVLDSVGKVARTDSTVLVNGETGTGKELIARAVHSASTRAAKPLIKVNCAALPTGLVESELFGHERGAFSGAIQRRIGRFELANGGTIFLDEIGELSLEVQAKLLRVLQEREFERVGGSVPIKVDVRIIAATNRDLRKCVTEGTFREDLFFRLHVFPIKLPALRERPDDIPLLVQFLMMKFRGRLGKKLDGVTPKTMQRLTDYAWPGNVREMENVLERAAILATGSIIDIPPDVLQSNNPPVKTPECSTAVAPTKTSLEDVEKQHIRAVLDRTNWVIDGPNGAAVILDVHPNTLRSRLKRFGVVRQSS